MPMRITSTAGGTGYVDIRVGANHDIHQVLLDVSGLTDIDADGYLPVGFPILSTGLPVTAGTAYGYIGPEAVYVGSTSGADVFANCIMGGALNRDAIEDNLGRVLTAAEIAGKPSTISML